MPIDYSLDTACRLVLITGYGRITGAEAQQADELMRADPAAQPEYNQLSDYTRVTENLVSAADLRALAARPPFFSPASRRAVVGKGPLAYGNMRMFELLRNDAAGTFRFFENREDAERWVMEGAEAAPDPAPESPPFARFPSR